MAFFRDLFGGVFSARARKPDTAGIELPPVPTSDDLLQKIVGIDADIDAKVAQGRVPDLVSARVHRITATARDVVPALDRLGAGSRDAHSVMSTQSQSRLVSSTFFSARMRRMVPSSSSTFSSTSPRHRVF